MQVEAFSVVVKLRVILANVCLKLYRPLSGGRAVHVQAAAVGSGGVYSTGGLGPGRGEETSAGQTITSELQRVTHGSHWSHWSQVVTGGQNNADIY